MKREWNIWMKRENVDQTLFYLSSCPWDCQNHEECIHFCGEMSTFYDEVSNIYIVLSYSWKYRTHILPLLKENAWNRSVGEPNPLPIYYIYTIPPSLLSSESHMLWQTSPVSSLSLIIMSSLTFLTQIFIYKLITIFTFCLS